MRSECGCCLPRNSRARVGLERRQVEAGRGKGRRLRVRSGVLQPERGDNPLLKRRGERPAGGLCDDRVQKRKAVPVVPERRSRDPLRGVAQEMTHPHRSGALQGDAELRDGIVERGFPFLDELQQDDGREGLRDGSEMVDRGVGREAAGGEVGRSERALTQTTSCPLVMTAVMAGIRDWTRSSSGVARTRPPSSRVR